MGRSLYVISQLNPRGKTRRRDDIRRVTYIFILGVLDREGNARKVVNCSCVVVKDWGEESQERSIILNYFQTSQ